MRCIVCENEYSKSFQCNGYTYMYCAICGMMSLVGVDNSIAFRKSLYDDLYWINNNDDCDRNSPKNVEAWFNLICKYTDVKLYNLIDFGCGRGHFIWYSDILYGMEGIGFDWASPLNIVINPKRIITDSRFVSSVNDECVDMLACIETFQHLVDPRLYLLEFSRIVKPGGIILLVTNPNDDHQANPSEWFYMNPPYHTNVFSTQAISHLADDCYLQLMWYDGGATFILKSQPKDEAFFEYYKQYRGV